MFIDSESNQNISSFADENFSNHPGFIDALWNPIKDVITPQKQEEKRYKEEEAKQKARCNYSAGDSCADLNNCENYFQGVYNANTGNTRVPKRIRKAANYHRNKIVGYMNARDCDGATSAIDTAQEQTWQSNQEAIDAQAAAAAAEAAAQASIKEAEVDANIRIEQEKLRNAKAIKALEREAKIRQDAEESKQLALDEKNKMIMFGGAAVGVILLVLILNK